MDYRILFFQKRNSELRQFLSQNSSSIWNAIKEDLKSASRFRFKKLKKNLSSPNIDWYTLYAANCVRSCCFFLLLYFFVCVFVYLLQLIYFFFACFSGAFVYL